MSVSASASVTVSVVRLLSATTHQLLAERDHVPMRGLHPRVLDELLCGRLRHKLQETASPFC